MDADQEAWSGQFFVQGPLPGLNEIIDAAKRGMVTKRGKRWDAYQDLKRHWMAEVAWAVRIAQVERPAPGQLSFLFTWYEKDRRRDKDNVAAGGRKLVFDGLVHAGVIPNDGWKWIGTWTDTFKVVGDPRSGPAPGVMVTMAVCRGDNEK